MHVVKKQIECLYRDILSRVTSQFTPIRQVKTSTISYQHNLVEIGHQCYVSNGIRCVGINNIYDFLSVWKWGIQ